MDRKQSAEVLSDVVIYRRRSDVPADVVEAIDVAMQIFAREPRMEREKEARLTQLENALRALLDAIDDPAGTEVGDELAADEARALLDGEGTPADTEDPDA